MKPKAGLLAFPSITRVLDPGCDTTPLLKVELRETDDARCRATTFGTVFSTNERRYRTVAVSTVEIADELRYILVDHTRRF